jgi:hypothetical protein
LIGHQKSPSRISAAHLLRLHTSRCSCGSGRWIRFIGSPSMSKSMTSFARSMTRRSKVESLPTWRVAHVLTRGRSTSEIWMKDMTFPPGTRSTGVLQLSMTRVMEMKTVNTPHPLPWLATPVVLVLPLPARASHLPAQVA